MSIIFPEAESARSALKRSLINEGMTFVDLHQDIASATTDLALSSQTDISQLEQARVKIVLGTGFTLPEEHLESVIERDLAFYAEQYKAHPNWRTILTGRDVENVLKTQNAHGIIFHIEGFPHLAKDWDLLDRWYQQGWRSAGLVWNDDNPLGGGTDSEAGLTSFGREFIAWCEERNILIDLAHANRYMFSDVIDSVKNPPFISHCGLYSVVSNYRNYTGDQLKEVARRGGICGIFFAKSAMAISETFEAEDIATHIKVAIDFAGEDAVAIGTDFGGIVSGTPSEIPSIIHLSRLQNALREIGLTERQIEKVTCQNAERYLRENLPA